MMKVKLLKAVSGIGGMGHELECDDATGNDLLCRGLAIVISRDKPNPHAPKAVMAKPLEPPRTSTLILPEDCCDGNADERKRNETQTEGTPNTYTGMG